MPLMLLLLSIRVAPNTTAATVDNFHVASAVSAAAAADSTGVVAAASVCARVCVCMRVRAEAPR